MKKKLIISMVLALATSSIFGISASAARSQGAIGDPNNPTAAYDYTLRNPLLPWDCVKGYSNTTFVVDQTTIKNGFSAYSYIYAKSNDGNTTASKTTYVTKGTNYARTGDISLNGHKKNCNSTHKSVYAAKSINQTKYLNS